MGDYSKAEKKFGWRPKTKFDSLANIMVKSEVEQWERWLKGEKFAWDAPNYPSESKILTRYLRV
jgi:GDPmannose 4,6-dehydratase